MRIKTCTICSAKYEVAGKRFATTKYCSMACSGLGKRRQVDKKCRNCGETFLFKPSQLSAYPNAGKYCSRKCGYEYRVKKNVSSPTKDKYGRTNRKADVEWRIAVREKFQCICQRCGVKDEHIDTHHMHTRASRPDLKHDIDNGVALCRTCHSWVHHHPQEASELGLLKGASYERTRLMGRYKKLTELNRARVTRQSSGERS